MFERAPAKRTRVVLRTLEIMRLVKIERLPATNNDQRITGQRVLSTSPGRTDGQIISSTNLTILNVLLVHFGPMRERTLCSLLGGVQVMCSLLAFAIRYGVGSWVYGGERR
jgi:UDP-N-acetylglucosamine--dolichyl-phosphate N-acetylglucosaminephosphotransferase